MIKKTEYSEMMAEFMYFNMCIIPNKSELSIKSMICGDSKAGRILFSFFQICTELGVPFKEIIKFLENTTFNRPYEIEEYNRLRDWYFYLKNN